LGADLDAYSAVGILRPAVVVSVADRSTRVFVKGIGFEPIGWDGLSWARRARGHQSLGPAPKSAGDVVSPGDVVYVATDGKQTQLAQIPRAQAALVALDPTDGAIAALVGGFDYFASKYNRAVDAKRQPGSGFKPFLYSAALDDGFTPGSILLDEPIVVDNRGMEAAWRPENDGGTFQGPIRLREALAWSRNLASIRLLRRVGIAQVTSYAARFGFDPRQLPQNLTLALGTLQTTPLQMAAAYAVFANGGFRVEPYFIERIVGPHGKVIFQAQPKIACPSCETSSSAQAARAEPAGSQPTGISGPMTPAALVAAADASRGGRGALPAARLAPRVISAQNDYLMTSLLQSVITEGTGQRALALHRDDIAGKTGTTNRGRNTCDAWFNGYTEHLVATVWVGYDDERALGPGEEGAHTALPIWVYFMQKALEGVPQERRPMPDGLVTLRISPTTGRLVSAENPDGILETFMANHLPVAGPSSETGNTSGGTQTAAGASLF
ncbi:MAG: penicillin-binding protein 1A, partial [Steroidobacteraceae bacterium]